MMIIRMMPKQSSCNMSFPLSSLPRARRRCHGRGGLVVVTRVVRNIVRPSIVFLFHRMVWALQLYVAR